MAYALVVITLVPYEDIHGDERICNGTAKA